MFSRFSWKTLSVMLLPTLNTLSARLSPRLTLSMLLSARAALCTVLEVKLASIFLLMNANVGYTSTAIGRRLLDFSYQVLSAHSVNFSLFSYLSPPLH